MRKVDFTPTGRTILVVDEQEDFLVSVLEKLERREPAHGLSETTANILLYSRLEAGAIEVVQHEIDLDRLLRGLPELVASLLAGKNVEFALDAEDRALRLTTDAAKVEIILHNLLSNAAKFTDQGSIGLKVAPFEADVQFAVRDTGIGIATEHLENVFEPFWQANRGASRDLGGIGLGLALSRRLALLLGGSLRVTSELGAGSNFTLTLPIAPEVLFTSQTRRAVVKPSATSTPIKTSRSPFGFFRPF
jgi:signal transduction histidine kinase